MHARRPPGEGLARPAKKAGEPRVPNPGTAATMKEPVYNHSTLNHGIQNSLRNTYSLKETTGAAAAA
jgi:hypothetical protein